MAGWALNPGSWGPESLLSALQLSHKVMDSSFGGGSHILEPGLHLPLIFDIYRIINLMFAAAVGGTYSYSKTNEDKAQEINGSSAVFLVLSASQGIVVYASGPTGSSSPRGHWLSGSEHQV